MEKVKVLVIDDSPFIFKAVQRGLDDEKFQVIDRAANGKIGLEMVDNYKPDIITLDVTMPVMDGIEAAEVLKEKGLINRVIIMSAMGDDDLINQACSIGINHFLTKPFKQEELLAIVDRIIKEES